MEPFSIFAALTLMATVLFVPGFVLSLVLSKDMELEYRIVLSFVLGLMPVYVVYMLVKNNFAIFNISLDVMVFVFFVALGVLAIKDVRRRVVGWWFTD